MFLIELIKLLQKVLQDHHQLLSQVLHFSLDSLAGDMFSKGLISESTKNSPTYDDIMNNFIARMNEQNNAAQLEEFCQLLLACISKQNGASSQEVAKMLSKQWQEVALKHCGISLSFNTDTNPKTTTEGVELGLLNAAKYGHNETVQFLITLNVNIDFINEQGRTALMLASECGHEPVVQTLISGGANVNAQDNEEQTALMIATKNNSFEIVSSLLIAGTDADKADKNGETALTIACRMGHSKIGKLLIEKNAKVFTTTSSGDTPLLLSTKSPVLCKIILSKLPSNVPRAYLLSAFTEACKHGKSVVIVMLLQRLQKEMELFMSSAKGSSSIKDLVTHTAVDSTLVGGITPLMIASSCGHTDVVEELLKSGANVNSTDDNGSTPLVYALNGSSENSSCVVELLIHAGADLSSAVSKLDETQLENILCKEQNNCAAMKLFLLAKKFECLIDEVKLALEKKLSLNELLMADVVNYIGTLVYLPNECENIDILFSKLQVSFSTLNVGLIQKVVTKFFPSSSEIRIHMEKYVEMLQTYESNTTMEQVGQSMEVIPLPQPNTSTQVIIKFSSAWWKVSIKNMKKFLNKSFCVSSCFFNHVSISEDDTALICKYYLPECQSKTLLATAEQNSTFMGSVGVFEVTVVTGDSEVIVLKEKMNNSFEFQSTFLKSSTTDVNIDVIEFFTQLERCINIEDKNEAGRTVLMLATECGHEPVVQTLISGGANINAQDNEGWTPLMIASKYNFINIVHILLKADADPYMKKDNGSNALTIGSFHGSYEVVELLITQEKVDCNYQRNNRSTSLMLASLNGHSQVAKLLLNYQANPDLSNNNGDTALMMACSKGHNKIVELLLSNNVDVNVRTNDGYTALMLASENGHLQIVKQLLEKKANISIRDKNGLTALALANQNNHSNISKLILEKAKASARSSEPYDELVLLTATKNGCLDKVKELLECNANPNVSDKHCMTPLHIAVSKSKNSKEYLKIIKLLLEQPNINVNAVASNGMTCLGIAVEEECTEVMELLLNAGANPNVHGKNKITILNEAIVGSDMVMFKLLLKHGANPNLADGNNVKPIDVLIRALMKLNLPSYAQNIKKEMLQILITQPTFDIDQVLVNGMTSLMAFSRNGHTNIVKLFLEAGANPNIQYQSILPTLLPLPFQIEPSNGSTALMFASLKGHTEIVELLLKHKANPDVEDEDGDTALSFAVQKGHVGTVKCLLKSNPNVNLRSIGPNALGSPLFVAIDGLTAAVLHLPNQMAFSGNEKNYTDILKLLIKNPGTDVNIKEKKGMTCLMRASAIGCTEVVEWLLEAGANPNIQIEQPTAATQVNDFFSMIQADLMSGMTALMFAANKGYSEIVTMLLKANAKPDLQNTSGDNALFIAISKGHAVIVQQLLQYGADPCFMSEKYNGTPLHMVLHGIRLKKTDLEFSNDMAASTDDFLEVLKVLLQHPKVNVDVVNSQGCTGLMIASSCECVEAVELLINAGADPNIQTHSSTSINDTNSDSFMLPLITNGVTALMIASERNNTEIVKLLLQGGANPNTRTQNGNNSLLAAANKGYVEVVKLLLEFKADPVVFQEDGATPLHIAITGMSIKRGNIEAPTFIKRLLTGTMDNYTKIAELLVAYSNTVNTVASNGYTSLMIAGEMGCVPAVRLLLEAGADTTVQLQNGLTVNELAILKGHKEVVQILKDFKN